MEVHYMYTYEDSKIKPIKRHLKRGEEGRRVMQLNGGAEHVQGTLYTCMELPQWNLHIWLMYNKSEIKNNWKYMCYMYTYAYIGTYYLSI
jgi:hypothetical protein